MLGFTPVPMSTEDIVDDFKSFLDSLTVTRQRGSEQDWHQQPVASPVASQQQQQQTSTSSVPNALQSAELRVAPPTAGRVHTAVVAECLNEARAAASHSSRGDKQAETKAEETLETVKEAENAEMDAGKTNEDVAPELPAQQAVPRQAVVKPKGANKMF
jgi:hypothetical protein